MLYLNTHVVMRFLQFTRHATHATEVFQALKLPAVSKKDCVAVGTKLFQPEVGFCCCGVIISGRDSSLLHCSTSVVP